MTPAATIAEHCIATMLDLPTARRIVLLRSLAIEINDQQIARHCRNLADELERVEKNHAQLLLNLRTKRAA